jgi:hypothetical protein
MLRSDGLRWKNKGHLISFGRMRLHPKRPPPLSISTSGEKKIADFVFNAQNRAEDIALVRNMGFEVDDINKPTPENVPAGEAPPVNGGNSWKGRSGVGRH